MIKCLNFQNINLLMLSVKLGNEEIFDYLFKHFPNLYFSDCENNNLLFYIARYGTYQMMKKVLQLKPIIEGKNKDGLDIITLSIDNPHPVNLLLDTYINSYEYKLYKRTYPFHIAVIKRDYDLLEHTPNISKKDAIGISILEYINSVNDPIINKMFKL